MKLDGLRLPGKEHPKEALPALYEQLLRDHGIRTKAQISILREEVIEHLMTLQDVIIAQNAADIMAGKYRDEADMAARMPLYRNGDKMRNVPDSIMKWYAFTAWLNEKVERRWVN
ncbi:MAG: hypothetical protein IKH57_04695 [Clostridia bacterium]|nr:hypothetical protein [Clostridia bacterium]